MPALPLHEAGKYVAAAYIVFFALVLIYVSIMSIKLSRLERELVAWYEALVDEVVRELTPATHAAAVQLARRTSFIRNGPRRLSDRVSACRRQTCWSLPKIPWRWRRDFSPI